MLRDRKWLIPGAAAVVCLFIWVPVLLSHPNTLELTYLDVGEGLCGVMKTPSGRIVVLDCGTSSWSDSASVGEKLVAPYLQRLGADTIDLAVLSHPHADHVCGFPSLFAVKPPKVVLDIGARHDSPEYEEFLRAVRESKARYRIAHSGQSIDLGDGIRAEVLSPDTGFAYTDLNERSTVMRVTFRKAVFLLCADAGAEAESRLLKSGAAVRAQVMQVGHHGSDTASTAEWLAAVRPAVAIISCGRGGQSGHPSRQVLDRLRGAGARVYRTDLNGAVSVITDGRTIRIRTHRRS